MARRQTPNQGIDEDDLPKNVVLCDDEARPFQCKTCGNHVTLYQLKCNRCLTPTGATLASVERFRGGPRGDPSD